MDTREAVQRLATAAEKLVKEVAQLHAEVARLNLRIEPVNTEGPPSWFVAPSEPQKVWNIGAALNLIESMRRDIRSAEYHLSAIRARADNIAADGISREEMKPWIKR